VASKVRDEEGRRVVHPRCFCERVWKMLEEKELVFGAVQKSAEECRKWQRVDDEGRGADKVTAERAGE